MPETGRHRSGRRCSPTGARLWLEIGFGGGEHLAAQAAAHPEVGLIGCEPYIAGVARLLALAEARAPRQPARRGRRRPPAAAAPCPMRCLERIFVLFPDPWPKTRHHKRRIVNPATAAEFARLLAPGGELRLATDDMGYARAMLLALPPVRELVWLAERPVGLARAAGRLAARPATRTRRWRPAGAASTCAIAGCEPAE